MGLWLSEVQSGVRTYQIPLERPGGCVWWAVGLSLRPAQSSGGRAEDASRSSHDECQIEHVQEADHIEMHIRQLGLGWRNACGSARKPLEIRGSLGS